MIGKRIVSIAAVALLVAACGGSSTPAPTNPPATNGASTGPVVTPVPTQNYACGKLTVWLMPGSLTDAAASQVNTAFNTSHPCLTVNYQVQQWSGIVAKITTALASNNPPDVFEIGNTQAPTYAASGGLYDLTAQREALGGGTSATSSDPNEGWVAGLNDPCVVGGKTMCMAFYGASRMLFYRADLFAKSSIDAASLTSKDKLIAAAKKLQADNASTKDFSGYYLPGENWYALMQNIWDEGGQVATVDASGKWTSQLSSPASQKGIQDYVDYFKAANTSSKTNDEVTPDQKVLFQQGKVGIMMGLPWDVAALVGPSGAVTQASQVGVMPIPSVNDGKTVPVFLGGSELAVAKNSKNINAALDYLALMSSPTGQAAIMSSNWIPGTKSAAANIADTPTNRASGLLVMAQEAAAASNVTPLAKGWATVESGSNPLKTMLGDILTGKLSIADAAKKADDAINAVING